MIVRWNPEAEPEGVLLLGRGGTLISCYAKHLDKQTPGAALPESNLSRENVFIVYQRDLAGVDWETMKNILSRDSFDNGRTPAQLEASFANGKGGRKLATERAVLTEV
jgi:hypothetical protein